MSEELLEQHKNGAIFLLARRGLTQELATEAVEFLIKENSYHSDFLDAIAFYDKLKSEGKHHDIENLARWVVATSRGVRRSKKADRREAYEHERESQQAKEFWGTSGAKTLSLDSLGKQAAIETREYFREKGKTSVTEEEVTAVYKQIHRKLSERVANQTIFDVSEQMMRLINQPTE